jgi:hypothetical protein
MEALQRVKLDGFQMVISELEVEMDYLRRATLLGRVTLNFHGTEKCFCAPGPKEQLHDLQSIVIPAANAATEVPMTKLVTWLMLSSVLDCVG